MSLMLSLRHQIQSNKKNLNKDKLSLEAKASVERLEALGQQLDGLKKALSAAAG